MRCWYIILGMDHLHIPGGYRVSREEQAIVIGLGKPRRVLGTSVFNGGCREDLQYLFNYCEAYGAVDERCEMRAATYREHLRLLAEELKLPPSVTTGLSTAAKMKYARVHTRQYEDFSVTALATAGIDFNGSRAGDPAFFHEQKGLPVVYRPNTINIFLFIGALLSEAALTRALVTLTEAKTAALQEVLAPSCYSAGLATGSGTDGAIIACDLDAPVCLTDAGQHSKLGEYIGKVIKDTVKEALVAENGFDAYANSSVLRRIGRFGINEQSLWAAYQAGPKQVQIDHESYRRRLRELDGDRCLMTRVSLYAHLLDLLHWGLVDPGQAGKAAEEILRLYAGGSSGGVKRSGFAAEGINPAVKQPGPAAAATVRADAAGKKAVELILLLVEFINKQVALQV